MAKTSAGRKRLPVRHGGRMDMPSASIPPLLRGTAVFCEPLAPAHVNRIIVNHQWDTRGDMKPFERISNPREIRRKLRMNQQEFWSRIGVTQSGGSRYESGRTMPKPVRELLRLVHIEGVELARARGEDLEVVAYLKQSNPRLYRTLKKAALSKGSRKK